MIFILKESIMNGTVTMFTKTTGIEANTFEEAKEKVKLLPNVINKFDVIEKEDLISIKLKPEFIESYPCYGTMDN